MNNQSWIETPQETRDIIRPPVILPFPDKKSKYLYQLYEDVILNTPYGPIKLPLGLVTDGASIPRIIRPFIERDGMLRLAAQLHDLLFQTKGCWNDYTFSLKQCNWLYYYFCRQSGVSEWDAQIMHIGLTLGSWIPWKNSLMKADIRPLYYQIS